ncbi:MAG: UDP-glucose 4-epimerase GalE [Patescibacteria group bacterium]
MKNKKIMVVGGAGYIGSHVAKTLMSAGHQITVFDNLITGSKDNVPTGANFILGDVTVYNDIKEALRGFDAVIYLAALKAVGESMTRPGDYAVNNIYGAINLLNAMAENGVNKIVFSSTAAVYGTPVYLPVDEKHPTDPINFYGFTKLEIERILKWYDQLKGIKFAALRYFNAVGYDTNGELHGLEKNPQNLLPILFEAVFGQRSQVEIFGTDYETPDGTCVRDYIHVDDLSSAHILALNYLDEKNDSLTVNLGTANGISVKEMIDSVKKISGVDFPVKVSPRRPGDTAKLLANSNLAQELLDWKAQHSDIETIVATTLAAYQKNYPAQD